MAEKKKFGPGFTKKEIAAAKKRRVARRLEEEEKRTGKKLKGKAAPKPVKRGKTKDKPSTVAATSVKPGSARGVISGEAGKKRVEKAEEKRKRRK